MDELVMLKFCTRLLIRNSSDSDRKRFTYNGACNLTSKPEKTYSTLRLSLNYNSIKCFLFLSTFLMPTVIYAQEDEDTVVDRCNITEPYRVCEEGVMLPAWPPSNTSALTTADIVGRSFVYLISLIYLFLGVSIVADRFMASIEVITSKEKEVIYKKPNGEEDVTTVRIWNETVSNLTLMALGSSAPEIMLSVIEVVGKGFRPGAIGPSTIVGSAAFNLFIIIAICMYVIPDGEIRKVKHLRVFFITASCSILAYVWLYVILAVISYGVVDIWEGVVTLLFFPILVVIAWIADRRLLVYKLMYKRYRTRRRKMIVETEGSPALSKHEGSKALHLTEIGENGGKTDDEKCQDDSQVESDLEDIDPENSRKKMIRLMRELRKKHPDANMSELARLASADTLSHQPKSRAFYRIQATRKMTGAGNVLHNKKLEHKKSSESLATVMGDADDAVAKIFFDPAEYKVLENCGFAEISVARKGGDLNKTLYVDFHSEDGTANAGSDYEAVEDTLVFEPGETIKKISVKVLDDDVFEEDEYFKVHLVNARTASASGMFDTDVNSTTIARIEAPCVAVVTILDDDHAGVFSFTCESLTVSECVGILKVEVQRNAGARGKVIVPYKTVNGTAKGGGEDFVDTIGELEFENDETSKFIHVQIIDDEEYEKNKSFFLELSQPSIAYEKPCSDSETDVGSDSGINGKEEEKQNFADQDEEDKRVAELGKARLGEHKTIEIMIEESYEFKNTVDKLIKKANLAVVVGTSSWREQFVDALSVSAGDDDDDDDGDDAEPTKIDYVMHYLTVLWKLLFAFVPPTEYMGGWACFTVSIIMIGVLTAVIGDVASHFGCIVNLNDAVTAVTLVAMGTSVPDTFASKVAAVGDQYADASIGNVTGSNAVNVFLGIGIAWTIAAIYWAVVGETPKQRQFHVPPGNLAFSVTVFSIFALFAVSVLMVRRKVKSIGGELGGPRTAKIISSSIFVLLWIIYIALAALDSYCIIKTF